MCEALRELMADELKDAENKGVELGKIDMISEMLRNGKTPEEIAEFCKYPIEKVLEIQKNLK